MALTLQQAFDAFKAARATAAEKKAVRKDVDERARVAMEEDRAAGTAMDNAKMVLDATVNALSEPKGGG